ncbi:MAG: Ig-like domain-containing protein [Bacteroidetes bacterium]|nr:Ig-like domain-containing protein [Bacteroidota bacterium]
MRKQIVRLNVVLLALVMLIGGISCKKSSDSSTTAFGLSSLMCGTINMNGATSPTNIPTNPTIVATFTVGVSAASVVNAITLIRNYDTASISVNVTVSGSTITIVPVAALGNGSLYSLKFSGAITSTDGQGLAAFTRTFTTIGSFIPDGMIAYYTFENTASDVLNNYNPKAGGVIGLTYAPSFSTAAGQAAKFDGATTLIEIPNGDALMLTNDFTMAFWIKADSTKHGQFCMGIAGWYGFQFEIAGDYSWCKLAAQYACGTTSASQDLWFPGDGKTKDNGGWKGWTYCKDLTGSGGVKYFLANNWCNVVCRFTASTKIATMYFNGVKMKEQDYNLYDPPLTQATGLVYNGATGNNTFVFGFIQDKDNPTIPDAWASYDDPANNHFKGLLDNVRFWHKSLTETEIQMMYNSEKP